MMQNNCLSVRTLSLIIAVLILTAPAVHAAPWARHTVDASSRGADGVRLADVNGDGLPDVVTPWEEGGVVRVYINPGPKDAHELWQAVTVGEAPSPEDAVFVDLDGDGVLDVVSSCEGKVQTVWFHWAPASRGDYMDPSQWKTEAVPALQGVSKWMMCLPMDVDGKNGIDLICGSKGDKGVVGWLESPGNPRDAAAWRWHPLSKAAWVMTLMAVDMDGDGDEDIFLTDRKGALRGCRWLANPGKEDLAKQWISHVVGAQEHEVMFMCRERLAKGAAPRILVTTREGNLVIITPETGAETVLALPDWMGTGKGIAVGDMDLDGSQDIVFSCEHAEHGSGVGWMRRSDEAGWETLDIGGREGVKYDLVELLDLDADGDLDVLTCEERDNLGVIWYENPAR